MLVVAVSPLIAPTLGGYITAEFGWRFIFAILIGLVLIIIAGVYFLLPESKDPDPNFSLKPAAIITNFAGVIKEPQFYTYAVTGAVSYGGLCAYISGSPNVFMEIFHMTEKHYGWIFAVIALGIISASQVSNFALRKYSSEQLIKTALSCQVVIGLVFLSLAILGLNELYSTIFLIFLFLGCQGFIFPNASALSLASFGHNAGSASALMGGIQMTLGASASALVSLLQNQTALPMAGVMASCSMMALCILLWGSRIIVQKARLESVEGEDVEMISTL